MWQFPVIFAPMQIISNFTETDCMSSSPTEHWAVGKEYCLFLFFFFQAAHIALALETLFTFSLIYMYSGMQGCVSSKSFE